MLALSIRKKMEEAGMVLQPPEYVATALVILASDSKWNGEVLFLAGERSFKIEDKIKETMPLWFGEWPTEQALIAGSIDFTGLGDNANV